MAVMRAHIHSEKQVTIPQIVDEADCIWKKMKESGIQMLDDKVSDLLKKLRGEHPEFSKSYPIVIRYIVEMQEYSSKIFKLWLRKIERNPWKSEEEFLEAQSNYVAMLYREKMPKAPQQEVQAVYNNTLKMLTDESNAFKEAIKQIEQELIKKEEIYGARQKADLRTFAQAAGEVGLSKAETFRVVNEPMESTTTNPTLDDCKPPTELSSDDFLS